MREIIELKGCDKEVNKILKILKSLGIISSIANSILTYYKRLIFFEGIICEQKLFLMSLTGLNLYEGWK